MTITGSAAHAALLRLGGMLPVEPGALSDLQLVALVETIAEARRQLDAADLVAAGEIARRSSADSPDSLARRLGYHTPAQAIEAITKTTGAGARKLVADAQAIAKLPAVEAAVLDGRIGREAGAAIAGELKAVTAGAPDGGTDDAAGRLAAAEEHLVEISITTTADQVRARAQEIAVALTPEAVEAQSEKAMRDRFFWVSSTRDGVARVKGLLPAGHAAVIRGVLDAYSNPRGRKTVEFVDAETDTPAGTSGTLSDGRSHGQKNADLLRDIFAAQARAADAPDMGGDHPTVWITTTASELAGGDGLAFYAGTAGAVPVAEAAQAACSGGVQTVIFGDDGRLLELGRETRGFSRRQRRAIATRDGGTCLIPGCTVPAQWCEVHHVTPYRDGGPTDASNGTSSKADHFVVLLDTHRGRHNVQMHPYLLGRSEMRHRRRHTHRKRVSFPKLAATHTPTR
ncbi:DUF222 domain-containing protein [Gryllotalpicola reticulitermitis]|uniref:DUF222 domain-containing protein n=1 Tax=Gryllotalpicola reticulitermitis TaxID=1184153 RepID=A0ABV8QBG1_9MICO